MGDGANESRPRSRPFAVVSPRPRSGDGQELATDDGICELALSDADRVDFTGGSVTVSLPGVPDSVRLLVRNEGSGIGEIGFDGKRVSFSGIPIGVARSAAGPDAVGLRIDLDGRATAAAVEALLESLVIVDPTGGAAAGTAVVCVMDARGRGSRGRFALRPGGPVAPPPPAPAASAGAERPAATAGFMQTEAEADGFVFASPGAPRPGVAPRLLPQR